MSHRALPEPDALKKWAESEWRKSNSMRINRHREDLEELQRIVRAQQEIIAGLRSEIGILAYEHRERNRRIAAGGGRSRVADR